MEVKSFTDSTVLKQPQENDKAIVVNQIIVRNIDRTMKDIATWRNAHIAAERIVWPIRQRLYDVYADVILDGHLTGIIKKRFSAVLNKELKFLDKDKKEVEAMEPLLKSRKFANFRKEILNTILWGITGAEFPPGKEFDFVSIPRKHIKPEYKIIATEQYGFEGIDYTTVPNVMIMGETHDLGLLLNCSPYALWKRGGFADYAQFVEIFGQPVRIFKYDAYDTKTKNEVQDVADNTAGSMSLIIPKQAEFEMMDGKTANANGDLQVQFIKALNDELSVIVLGNTETTTSSRSSGQAQSKEHGKQQLEITKGDLDYELQYLNSDQFKTILKSFGFPAESGCFYHEEEPDVFKLAQRIIIDAQVCKIVPVDDDFFYKTYDIPKPDNYDELKAKMEEAKTLALQPPAAAPGKGKKNTNINNAEKKTEDDDPEDLKAELTMFDKIRVRLADFFDPAPRD